METKVLAVLGRSTTGQLEILSRAAIGLEKDQEVLLISVEGGTIVVLGDLDPADERVLDMLIREIEGST